MYLAGRAGLGPLMLSQCFLIFHAVTYRKKKMMVFVCMVKEEVRGCLLLDVTRPRAQAIPGLVRLYTG